MKIERLSTSNLREGIFCAHGQPHGEEMLSQLGVWLDGSILRGQFARDDSGEVAGFVIYYPIEQAPMEVEGDDLYIVQCVYVKPKFQSRGFGKALVEAALADAKAAGVSGLVAVGFQPGQRGTVERSPASFFQHIGMVPGASNGVSTLYYIRIGDSAVEPRFMPFRMKRKADGQRIRVDIFDCRLCHLASSNRDLVKTVVSGLPEEDVELVVHDQNSREAIVDKGMSAGVLIDGTLTYFTGPISEEDVWRAIEVAQTARKGA